MEQERFFSGYCRTQDSSRMVCAVAEKGVLAEVDCSYEVCPFITECTVAKNIRKLIEQSK